MYSFFVRERVRDLVLGTALLLSIAGLLLFPTESMAAAREGLTLCFNVIIPSLFPFFVLSSLVVDLGLYAYPSRLLEPVMRPLFHVGGSCCTALVLGFIGGYPVGAKTAIELYKNGLATRTETERLLAFCNNSGPAFILGVVGAGIFSSTKVGLLLYCAHALASLCVGLLFRFYKGGEQAKTDEKQGQLFHVKHFTTALTDCIKNSFSSVLNICAFVLFFTVVLRLLFCSGFLPLMADFLGRLFAPVGFDRIWAQKLLTGVLELSSGVASLSNGGNLSASVSMAAFMLGWAGISVHCQVLSFLSGSGLSGKTYVLGKLLHGGISAGLVWGFTRIFPLAQPVSVILSDQIAALTALEFSAVFIHSAVAAFLLLLVFLLLAFSCGKKRKAVIQCRK
ncbi:MAG: nucleoside recognition domain-containing protein [Oscillospiraceae bacterium]